MNPSEQIKALATILYKEIHRFMRIWTQTLIPPAIMIMLYFVIFGTLIGKRIGQMGMPIDLRVELLNGEVLDYNIPMTKMRGSKPVGSSTLLKSWSWAKP